MSVHVHMDAPGGVAGDMFLAAMLDAFPDLEHALRQDLADAGISEHARLEWKPILKSGFAARHVRFDIDKSAPPTRHWRDIREMLTRSRLEPKVRDKALAMFVHLAEAEAASHAIPIDDVHFHELADWDSLGDFVGAASLIVRSEVTSWSCGAIPLGSGFVQTEHGRLPVPVPAVTALLKGFPLAQDDAAGERVTPTGAAILKELITKPGGRAPAGRLLANGTGAGTRQLAGVPNIFRVLVLETEEKAPELVSDQVQRITFEIDDMTPEEMGVALDLIRADAAVLDAGFTLGFGKKGRPRFAVDVIAKAGGAEHAAQVCFRETSTIGLRITDVERRVLPRVETTVGLLRTKQSDRLGVVTTKVESDDLAGISSLAERRRHARNAEQCDD
ncbi:LarC family nickel insertion protein [Rhizobium sp. TH2]|uniref:LarC family nickel insertion protein n=1 Tax=Rhizobium sp. TH2 TaxID=2775403 RepID=UPI002157451B|nr:LarC family nickel insertion protein [Rhizobium sp. TH2]UVC06601.1 LarC family nickel insertion protein [Rhizobium sp. TH2]